MPSKLHYRAPLACLGLVLAACAPELNWRELKLGEGHVLIMLPCKPSSFERKVVLSGYAATWELWSCRAGDALWAVAQARMVDPEAARHAARGLQPATGTSAGQLSPQPRLRLDKADPVNGVERVRTAEPLSDGRRSLAERAVIIRGAFVIQASVVGSQIDDGAADVFFQSLRVAP